MSHAVVDKHYCKGCQRCMANCPKDCPEYMAFKDNADCIGCGICYTVCPDVAITVYKKVKEA